MKKIILLLLVPMFVGCATATQVATSVGVSAGYITDEQKQALDERFAREGGYGMDARVDGHPGRLDDDDNVLIAENDFDGKGFGGRGRRRKSARFGPPETLRRALPPPQHPRSADRGRGWRRCP